MANPAVFPSWIWIGVLITALRSQHYEVTHIISTMCVVRQSTVLIPCRYSHPKNERLRLGKWLYQSSPEKSSRNVFLDHAFEGRVELLQSSEDTGGNCSLLLRDVRDSDAGIFYFEFRTDSSAQNSRGISLEVTGAEVVISPSGVVTEGEWLFFICGSCIPSIIVPTYTWRRDGHVFSQNPGSNQLDLDPVKLEYEGQYSCTLSGHEGLVSSSVAITVRPGYSPYNVSVSISSSGDSINLICSSESNPPVHIYSWFKENQTSSVGSGQSFRSLESGWFYCVAVNKYGSARSDTVFLPVREGINRPVSVVTVAVIPAVFMTSVILIVAMVMFIRRKLHITTSQVENGPGLQQSHKKNESSDDTYMTLDPKSMCSDYDTLDNLRRSDEYEEL